jgi:hypothetical protein
MRRLTIPFTLSRLRRAALRELMIVRSIWVRPINWCPRMFQGRICKSETRFTGTPHEIRSANM